MATVVVDLDGVCYEWSRTAMYMLRRYRGLSFQHSESQSWDYIQENIPAEEWDWLWNEGVEQGLFRYGHMVKDCRWALEGIHSLGHDIKICTHRPDTAVNDTLEWVTYHFKGIPLRDIRILSNGEPKTVVSGDILIDDKPSNIVQWAKGNREAILFSRPWNDKYQWAPVGNGWSDTVQWVYTLTGKGRR